MNRDLQDGGEAVSHPGEKGHVVKAEMKVGRVEVSQAFEDAVESFIPAPGGSGEPVGVDSRSGERFVGPSQISLVGSLIPVDEVEVAVRLGVELPEFGHDRRIAGIGVGADEVGRAVVQRPTSASEAGVVVGAGLVEIDTKVEGRSIGMREGRQPGPDSGVADNLSA